MAYNLKTVCILIADDNVLMLELLKNMLLLFGVGEVVTSKNGTEAYEKYVVYKPDLVITDWIMEDLDGLELAKKIRESDRKLNPFVPIILMTGFSEKRRVLTARDSGITEFLAKPFSAEDLYKRLVQIIENPRQFVKADRFFGPDRRRTLGKFYGGPFRRDADDGKENPNAVKRKIEKVKDNKEIELDMVERPDE